ncbi:threonylcarbamoyl-AMP synthase-like [Uloborus diversus]|uniref:threonylcarbamoyl-AMP synthase-like n=1 Tax=Uloborus diversus TaxID=327109 RepID=UPI00240A8C3B|nr:threonylcarbamoyl-AMP synthase-like [Uloborus diversus]
MLAAGFKMTKIIKLLPNGSSLDEAVRNAANVLRDGKVIAVPSDTVYGIAALAQCDSAVKSIYEIKGRDTKKPLAICVGDVEDIPNWGKISFPKSILKDLLPGPVTVVMERKSSLNPKLNPGVSLVGIRIPKCNFLQSLASHFDEPLALTSANISSMESSLSVMEFKHLWPEIDLIIDGGILGQCDPKRLGSTVVDLSIQGYFKIIRDGCSSQRTKEILHRHGLKELG